MSYELLLERAQDRGDAAMLAELTDIGPPPYRDAATDAIKSKYAWAPTPREAAAFAELGALIAAARKGEPAGADYLAPGVEWVSALVRLNGLDDNAAVDAARAALDKVQLLDAADKKIGAYSKGMRQRVKLAQALVHDPTLLILDEPLTGMDPLMRRRTIRLIKDWARAGKHIIVSSHILHEIESMTSNILLINNGRILAEGNVHQIRELIDTHPHTVYIRASDPRHLAREFLAHLDVLSLRFEPGAVVVETAKPDAFYARLTELVAEGQCGPVEEVTSPDDNLQAVFKYLVKN